MATKSANVTARVQPEIKRQAEAVLDKLGLPVSVLIDTLYRQIIMTGGVPYSLTVPSLPARDSMTDEQFNIMMEKGYHQAKTGEGLSVEFARVFKHAVRSQTDHTGNRTDPGNCAVYFQNPVRTGNCAKMVGFFAVRNQKAGFHAIPLSSYSGRTVAHKRNSQNAL